MLPCPSCSAEQEIVPKALFEYFAMKQLDESGFTCSRCGRTAWLDRGTRNALLARSYAALFLPAGLLTLVFTGLVLGTPGLLDSHDPVLTSLVTPLLMSSALGGYKLSRLVLEEGWGVRVRLEPGERPYDRKNDRWPLWWLVLGPVLMLGSLGVLFMIGNRP